MNEDLAAQPRPGESANALREVIRRKAKARGIEVRFRVVGGVSAPGLFRCRQDARAALLLRVPGGALVIHKSSDAGSSVNMFHHCRLAVQD